MGFHESLSCFAEALSAVEGDDTSHAVPAEKHCVEPEESSQKKGAVPYGTRVAVPCLPGITIPGFPTRAFGTSACKRQLQRLWANSIRYGFHADSVPSITNSAAGTACES